MISDYQEMSTCAQRDYYGGALSKTERQNCPVEPTVHGMLWMTSMNASGYIWKDDAIPSTVDGNLSMHLQLF